MMAGSSSETADETPVCWVMKMIYLPDLIKKVLQQRQRGRVYCDGKFIIRPIHSPFIVERASIRVSWIQIDFDSLELEINGP